MSRALIACPTGGPRLGRLLGAMGWEVDLITGSSTPVDLRREATRRSAELVLAALPPTGWRTFIRETRQAIVRLGNVRLLFVADHPPRGVFAEVFEGPHATPLVGLDAPADALRSSIAAAD